MYVCHMHFKIEYCYLSKRSWNISPKPHLSSPFTMHFFYISFSFLFCPPPVSIFILFLHYYLLTPFLSYCSPFPFSSLLIHSHFSSFLPLHLSFLFPSLFTPFSLYLILSFFFSSIHPPPSLFFFFLPQFMSSPFLL